MWNESYCMKKKFRSSLLWTQNAIKRESRVLPNIPNRYFFLHPLLFSKLIVTQSSTYWSSPLTEYTTCKRGCKPGSLKIRWSYEKQFFLKQEARETVPTNIISFLRIEYSLFVKTWDPLNAGYLANKNFNSRQYIFSFFVINAPWEKAWPFVWTNLNPFNLWRSCAKFCWN